MIEGGAPIANIWSTTTFSLVIIKAVIHPAQSRINEFNHHYESGQHDNLWLSYTNRLWLGHPSELPLEQVHTNITFGLVTSPSFRWSKCIPKLNK